MFPYLELFWSAFFPHFPSFELNTESISPYSVRMRENARKMRTRKTPNTNTFYAVVKVHRFCLWRLNLQKKDFFSDKNIEKSTDSSSKNYLRQGYEFNLF